MVDLTQVLLIIVITTLTIILTFIGIQIVQILREVKKSLEKINTMLDSAVIVTESISRPLAGLGGMLDGLKSGAKAIEAIGNFLSRKKKNPETETE